MTLAGRDEKGKETVHGHMETKMYCDQSHRHVTCGLEALLSWHWETRDVTYCSDVIFLSLNYSPGAFLAFSFVLSGIWRLP